MTTSNDMPAAECPHCGATFQWDDYYELAVGDDRECPKCDKTIYVTEVEYSITATLSTMPEQCETPKRFARMDEGTASDL